VSAIHKRDLELVKRLYSKQGYSMQKIATRFAVSIDAVVYFMRKHKVPRRSLKEARKVTFDQKRPSFKLRKGVNRNLQSMGAMLYWAEGYDTEKATGIDFANSDPAMAKLFISFLRSRYILEEAKFRPVIYCYSNQDVELIKKFWSKCLNVPLDQFVKPYVREDYRKDGRVMKFGLVHIRYHDKKMLLDVRNLIESYKSKYCT